MHKGNNNGMHLFFGWVAVVVVSVSTHEV
jgi:hypothetical protein